MSTGVIYYTRNEEVELQIETCGPNHYIIFTKEMKGRQSTTLVSMSRKKAVEVAKAILAHVEYETEQELLKEYQEGRA